MIDDLELEGVVKFEFEHLIEDKNKDFMPSKNQRLS